MNAVEDFLEHYGIKGMKWGQRKRSVREEAIRAKQFAERKRPASEDFKKSRELKKKGARALSNQELKEVNNRLNLEQNFNRMNPNAIKKGQLAVGAVLAVGATANAAIQFANSPAGKALATKLFKKGGNVSKEVIKKASFA